MVQMRRYMAKTILKINKLDLQSIGTTLELHNKTKYFMLYYFYYSFTRAHIHMGGGSWVGGGPVFTLLSKNSDLGLRAQACQYMIIKFT